MSARVPLIVGGAVAASVGLAILGMYLAHHPPEGGRNLLTMDTPVLVEAFEIRDASGHALWSITSTSPKSLSSLHYGVVPAGFVQSVPAQGRPRAFVTDEQLRAWTLTADWEYEHSGVALGPDSFLGGGSTNGPRRGPTVGPTPGP